MPASATLNYWITESGSWQSFIDFNLPEDDRAGYKFLPVYDDFYLSLMSRAIELLRVGEWDNKDEILAVGKGLEIFSLEGKRESFSGVSYSNNILFAAGLYYLADFSASAWILARLYERDQYVGIDLFISNFLRRDLNVTNPFDRLLSDYLKTGSAEFLRALMESISTGKENAFDEDAGRYYSFVLAEALIKKFSSNNIWGDLLRQDPNQENWIRYVDFCMGKKVPVWTFFPSQKKAIAGGLLNGSTFSLQMPTSSGKTSISELVIYDEFRKNQECKILYLAPFRALASELKNSLASGLADLGIKSKTVYGGNLPTQDERNAISDVSLLISTPEKFTAIEDIFPEFSKGLTTIICDEGHLLDDGVRGLTYELLLSRLKVEHGEMRRFIFVSAIIPNISAINAWLGGSEETLVSSDYRPTELEYAFLRSMAGRDGGFLLDVNPLKPQPYNYKLYKFLSKTDLTFFNKEKNKAEKITSKRGISVATALKATQSGAVALFAPHKRGPSGVEDLVSEAIRQIDDKPPILMLGESTRKHMERLVEYFRVVFGSGYALTKSAASGFLFHHGDIPQFIREIIEDSIRKDLIRLVICTNTLAEGVNLPIKTIVIHATQRFVPAPRTSRGKRTPIKIRDLKNLIGRAGRAGKETKGLVIVPHEDDFSTVTKLITDSENENVRGQLHNIVTAIDKHLRNARQVVSEVTLERLSADFQELLDSIDVSLIDLLAEEVEKDALVDLVGSLVEQTLSYYQASENERATLRQIFVVRSNRLIPIIDAGDFKLLKRSGTNIRQFTKIREQFDFNDEIWNKDFEPLDDEWWNYLFDQGIFKIDTFITELNTFNRNNKCDLRPSDVRKAAELWMRGSWFEAICDEFSIGMHKTLNLIQGIIGFSAQALISAVIRIKELTLSDAALPMHIINWTSLLQHGIESQLELDLIEMGLGDRVAVLEFSNLLETQRFVYTDSVSLRFFISRNSEQLEERLNAILPEISRKNVNRFFRRLST